VRKTEAAGEKKVHVGAVVRGGRRERHHAEERELEGRAPGVR
jgi:hypothetical protein